MVEQLKNAIHHFAKRQMTWFKRDKRIHWATNEKQAARLVKNYLQRDN
jgi:tRNA dimethylallyltransferase